MASSEPAPPHQRRVLAARGFLWLSASSWSVRCAQIIVLLVLAKVLVPSEFGILSVAALTYNVLFTLTHLGTFAALTYLKDRFDIEEASRTALSICIVVGLILTGVTWVLAPLAADFFHSPEATFVLRGFALGITFDAAALVPRARLTRSLKFSRRTLTDTLPPLIGAAVTISVVLGGHPLFGLVAGQVTQSVSGATVSFLIGPRSRPGWNTAMAHELLRYGKYLSAADLVNLGLLNVDYIIVGHVLGPVALGYYALAYRVCFLPYISISVVASGALFPYYCRLPSREAQARTAESSFSLITALTAPWFAGLALFAGDIALLGGKWAPATGAIRFLAIYGLFLSLTLCALDPLKAIGRADLVFFLRGLHLAILSVVLVATVHSGITVVALDQAVVAGLIAAMSALLIIRNASVRPTALARSVGLPMLGAVGMAAVVLAFGRFVGLAVAPSWTSVLVLAPLALAVFAGIVLAVMPVPLRKGWAALRGQPDAGESAELPAGPSRPLGGPGLGNSCSVLAWPAASRRQPAGYCA